MQEFYKKKKSYITCANRNTKFPVPPILCRTLCRPWVSVGSRAFSAFGSRETLCTSLELNGRWVTTVFA